MRIQNKIIALIVPVIIVLTILFNLIFMVFFHHYVENQENLLLNSIKENISSYISQREAKYLGTVNDWGHWNDTYNFINDSDPTYIQNNLDADSISNIDVNFMLFVKNNSIKNRFHYDIYKHTLTSFPSRFDDDLNKLIEFSQLEDDITGIFLLGNEFYFVASTNITDSIQEKQTDGKLIIGRKIDENIILDIKTVTGCSDVAITSADKISVSTNDTTIIYNVSRINNQQDLKINLLSINPFSRGASVIFTLTLSRNLFLSGIKQAMNFTIFNMLGMCIILIIVFSLLGRYISKPFNVLLKDVRSIDLTKKDLNKLDECGEGEFNYLRKLINSLLIKIEAEQKEIIDSKEKLYTTLMSVGDGVMAVDTEGKIEFMNPVAQRLTGWQQEDAVGISIEKIFYIVNEYTREKVKNPIIKVFEKGEIVELSNHTLLISKDGTERPIEDSAAPIRDKSGSIVGSVLVFRDFSERKEKQRRIEYLSYHDQLTGLYNRCYFEDELKRLDIKKNLPISCVYADINGLKTFNDAFGHETGDQILQRVAEVFSFNCRTGDVFARTGGDEFIMLFPNTDQTSVEKSIKQIIERIEEKKILGINLSVSFGWAIKDSETQSIEDVLKDAENYMYQKKLNNKSSKQSNIIKSILKTLQLKCPRERDHSERVSQICEEIGKAYNLGDNELNELKIAGELHDIGKIAVDISVLNKSGKLTESEWAQIKNHPETGYRILSTSKEFIKIAEYVLGHHERCDGSGYPRALKGEEILWQSKVIAIADSYDAMTCERPYRNALSQEQAIEEIRKSAGSKFDPNIAKIFIEKVLGMTYDR